MKDRKAYWREYQRRRRQLASGVLTGDQVSPTLNSEEFNRRFKAECLQRGLTSHKHWRAKRSLKQQLFLELNPQSSAAGYIQQALWKRSQARARQSNIPFSLVPADIVLVDRCPILDLPLDYSAIGTRVLAEAPSVDRIDNAKGYVPGNVQVVSHRANKLKNDATLDELIALGNWAATKKT